MSNILRLLDLRVISYAGINRNKTAKVQTVEEISEHIPVSLSNVDPEGGIVIIFPNGYRYTELEADQGAGKTSIIECLKEATGGMAAPNALNTQDKDKKFRFTFIGLDGEMYEVRATKTTYDLWHIMTKDGEIMKDESGRVRKQRENSPKSLLQKIVGRSGVSPQSLKDMPGKEQIDWLKSISDSTGETLEFELNLNKQIKETYEARTQANRDAKNTLTLLKNNPYYNDYEKWQTHFEQKGFSGDEVQQKVVDANKKLAQYNSASNTVMELKKSDAAIDNDIDILYNRIAEIELKIKDKKQEQIRIKERIENGEKYLEENKNVPAEVEAANEIIQKSLEFNKSKNEFNNMVKQKQNHDHLESESIRLTNRLDELRKAKVQYIKTFVPEIEGLEVYVPDEEEKREGIYFRDKPLNFLAESELWEMAAQLWEKRNVKIIYVENVSSLGSGAVETFNKFIENGGYIFASKMNRKEKDLRVNFNVKIPD